MCTCYKTQHWFYTVKPNISFFRYGSQFSIVNKYLSMPDIFSVGKLVPAIASDNDYDVNNDNDENYDNDDYDDE